MYFNLLFFGELFGIKLIKSFVISFSSAYFDVLAVAQTTLLSSSSSTSRLLLHHCVLVWVECFKEKTFDWLICSNSGNVEDFTIPELPVGQNLVISIQTTWGDKHYVGLNGIEIFDSNGQPVSVVKVGGSWIQWQLQHHSFHLVKYVRDKYA